MQGTRRETVYLWKEANNEVWRKWKRVCQREPERLLRSLHLVKGLKQTACCQPAEWDVVREIDSLLVPSPERAFTLTRPTRAL